MCVLLPTCSARDMPFRLSWHKLGDATPQFLRKVLLETTLAFQHSVWLVSTISKCLKCRVVLYFARTFVVPKPFAKGWKRAGDSQIRALSVPNVGSLKYALKKLPWRYSLQSSDDLCFLEDVGHGLKSLIACSKQRDVIRIYSPVNTGEQRASQTFYPAIRAKL